MFCKVNTIVGAVSSLVWEPFCCFSFVFLVVAQVHITCMMTWIGGDEFSWSDWRDQGSHQWWWICVVERNGRHTLVPGFTKQLRNYFFLRYGNCFPTTIIFMEGRVGYLGVPRWTLQMESGKRFL